MQRTPCNYEYTNPTKGQMFIYKPRTLEKIDIDIIALQQIWIRNRHNFHPRDEWKIFQVIIQD